MSLDSFREKIKKKKESEFQKKEIDLDNTKLHKFLKKLHLSNNIQMSYDYGQSGQSYLYTMSDNFGKITYIPTKIEGYDVLLYTSSGIIFTKDFWFVTNHCQKGYSTSIKNNRKFKYEDFLNLKVRTSKSRLESDLYLNKKIISTIKLLNKFFITRGKIFKKIDHDLFIGYNGFCINKLKKQFKKLIDVDKVNLKTIKKKKKNLLSEYDKDNTGMIDLVENNLFKKMLNQYQKEIIRIDKNYIHKFVKLSNFLLIKSQNLQNVFNELQKIENDKEFNSFVEIFKNSIQTYNVLTLHSICMINSIVDEDLITFYEIYELFDSLKIFESNFEKQLSNQLSNINTSLIEVINSINDFESNLINSLDSLSYDLKDMSNKIEGKLKSIDSSLKFNNLLSLINTYQLHEVKKSIKK